MEHKPVGRFAPTPSGRMHLGNVFAAMVAWLSVRSREGALVLRIEDLDTQRTNRENADLLRQDLLWLGLDWDWEMPPQSQRAKVYDGYFDRLSELGLVYPCYCSRSQLHTVNAPHTSDGTYIYPGTCRHLTPDQRKSFDKLPAWRVQVPDRVISLQDMAMGVYSQNLASECGDFLIRRADGVYMYQLAVTVDDGEAGVTEVVRGVDLLSSSPRQIYLQQLFGFSQPEYGHVPMLVAPDGRRLSKRDRDMDLGQLRKDYSPEQILGALAHASGILDKPCAISARELAGEFRWNKLTKEPICPRMDNLFGNACVFLAKGI